MEKIVVFEKSKAGFFVDIDGKKTKIGIQYNELHNLVKIDNYSVGIGHTIYANIDETGSVSGMKKLGYWGKEDKTVAAFGFIYNLSRKVVDDPLDRIAEFLQDHPITLARLLAVQALDQAMHSILINHL